MPHTRRKDDEDTDLGLPRKLGWKVAFWALGFLQAGCATLALMIYHDLDDVKTRVARIEGHLSIQSTKSPKDEVATTLKPVSQP